ncbi:insulinase family protein, partial [Escherichia sp. TWPC-MK]
ILPQFLILLRRDIDDLILQRTHPLTYQKWYTPDAMTLLVVGNVDARSVVDQINKTFGELKGKRETPAPVPTLSPLRAE